VKRLVDKPFVLLGVNSDRDRELTKKFLQQEKITWRSWWDGGSTKGPIARKWNVRFWPTTYVLDEEGIIRFKNIHGEEMDKAIDTLLSEMEKKSKQRR
jgi:hypothetical protein